MRLIDWLIGCIERVAPSVYHYLFVGKERWWDGHEDNREETQFNGVRPDGAGQMQMVEVTTENFWRFIHWMVDGSVGGWMDWMDGLPIAIYINWDFSILLWKNDNLSAFRSITIYIRTPLWDKSSVRLERTSILSSLTLYQISIVRISWKRSSVDVITLQENKDKKTKPPEETKEEWRKEGKQSQYPILPLLPPQIPRAKTYKLASNTTVQKHKPSKSTHNQATSD